MTNDNKWRKRERKKEVSTTNEVNWGLTINSTCFINGYIASDILITALTNWTSPIRAAIFDWFREIFWGPLKFSVTLVISIYLSVHLWISTTGVTKAVVCAILSVGWMVHIKEPLLLIEKSSPCGCSGFPFSLYEWSFTICLMPYNRKHYVLSASLNKTFFLPSFESDFGHPVAYKMFVNQTIYLFI